MSFNISRKKIMQITLLIIAIFGVLTVYNWPGKPLCSSIDSVEASLKVKDIGGRTLIGLNADRDSLKFGVTSPGTIARRSINTRYSKNADVSVTMQGELAPWTEITPSNFVLQAKETQEVYFNVNIPFEAADGNYTGRAVFCFKDKEE